MTALDLAIRIGEEATARANAMVHRERRLKWWLHRIEHMIKTGRSQTAMEMAGRAIDFLNTKEIDMDEKSPPTSWVHALHQVTGLLAIRGERVSQRERAKMQEILKGVLREMEDDTQRIFVQTGSGPCPDDSDPFV